MNIEYSFNYQTMIEQIYDDARWEAYYDMVMIPLFNMHCKDKGIKIVPIHATRKSGRKPAVDKPHFIETYSWLKSFTNKNGEIEKKRVGIPDFVIVPSDSTYKDPKKALINIEFKLPENLTEEYIEIKPKKYKAELLNQFKLCNNIIFTDGVTWYFFECKEDIDKVEPIRLYDTNNNCWKTNDNNCTDVESLLSERINNFLNKVLS